MMSNYFSVFGFTGDTLFFKCSQHIKGTLNVRIVLKQLSEKIT